MEMEFSFFCEKFINLSQGSLTNGKVYDQTFFGSNLGKVTKLELYVINLK